MKNIIKLSYFLLFISLCFISNKADANTALRPKIGSDQNFTPKTTAEPKLSIEKQIENFGNDFTPQSSSFYAKKPKQEAEIEESKKTQPTQDTKKTNTVIINNKKPESIKPNTAKKSNTKSEKTSTQSASQINAKQAESKILFSTNKIFYELKSLDFKQEWAISGFNLPESTTSKADSSWIYVSNVNTSNDTGFISRIKKNGNEVDMNWITGLTQPTGMFMKGRNLYIASQEKVYVVDSTRGKVSDTVKPKNRNIKNINTIALADDGTLYASEITSGKILKEDNGSFIEWFQSDSIKHPNAIAVKGNKLFVATYGSTLEKNISQNAYGSIYTIDLFTREVEELTSAYKLGSLESMHNFDNGFIVTSSTGHVYYIDETNRILLLTLSPGITDAYVTDDMLFVVYLEQNKLFGYKIEKK